MVQLDTLDIRPLPGLVLKHFTAHDVVSKAPEGQSSTGLPVGECVGGEM